MATPIHRYHPYNCVAITASVTSGSYNTDKIYPRYPYVLSALSKSRSKMKKDIHPKYYPQAKISCACGSVMATGSIQPESKVEICSFCHPFYTGKEKLIDTTGRVERFKKIMEKKAAPKAKKERKKN